MRNPNILATCKECGGRLHTYDILHSYNQSTRYKECKKCGRQYRTIEMYESRYEKLILESGKQMGREETADKIEEILKRYIKEQNNPESKYKASIVLFEEDMENILKKLRGIE